MASPLDTHSFFSAHPSPNPNHLTRMNDQPWGEGMGGAYGAQPVDAMTPELTVASFEDEANSDIGWGTPAVVNTVANPERPHQCHWANCGKSFPRPSDLTKHQRYHMKGYACEEADCGKAFATEKDLRRHTKTHDKLEGVGGKTGAARGYRCSVPGCRKAQGRHIYNRRDNFVRHMRTKHMGFTFDPRDFETTKEEEKRGH